ncbi:MAG TPA: hypothetical protein DEO49_08170, partial [Sutterella sp.]|nr:hypothetical protein [Sutterella sp.]
MSEAGFPKKNQRQEAFRGWVDFRGAILRVRKGSRITSRAGQFDSSSNKRLQYYDAGESPGFNGHSLEDELETILKARPRQDWGYHLNGSWWHWFYADFTKYTAPPTEMAYRAREPIDESRLIKVYLSTRSVRNKDLFIDLLCFLYPKSRRLDFITAESGFQP